MSSWILFAIQSSLGGPISTSSQSALKDSLRAAMSMAMLFSAMAAIGFTLLALVNLAQSFGGGAKATPWAAFGRFALSFFLMYYLAALAGGLAHFLTRAIKIERLRWGLIAWAALTAFIAGLGAAQGIFPYDFAHFLKRSSGTAVDPLLGWKMFSGAPWFGAFGGAIVLVGYDYFKARAKSEQAA